MTDGVFGHPEWYDNLPSTAPVRAFQESIHKSQPKTCPRPCSAAELPSKLQKLVAGGGNCTAPRVMMDGHCVCAPGSVLNTAPTSELDVCIQPQAAQKMTFYMYRAQSDVNYSEVNVNMADLAGVMWYLHNEIVVGIPRKYDVTRILRYKVTMQNTEKFFKKWNKQFGPFVAFDSAQCTVSDCNKIWKEWGFVVGCQTTNPQVYNYRPSKEMMPYCYPPQLPSCDSGTWYSLPGPCPEGDYESKTAECKAHWPGGLCDDPDGSDTCTYKLEPAGEVGLDELEGIHNYQKWWLVKNKLGETVSVRKEWDPVTDKGVGMSFWDDKMNKTRADGRMQAVMALFKKRYPHMPAILPQPACT